MSSPEFLLYTSYCDVRVAWVQFDEDDREAIVRAEIQKRRSFRAGRLVDDPTRFLFLNIPQKARTACLHDFLVRANVNGLIVDNLPFSFLGITESGIKEGQVIFFHEDRDYSVCQILEECGDIMDVFLNSGPGKYAARLGLSFSSTLGAKRVSRSKTLMIQDRTASDITNTTDGCGLVRESFFRKIMKSYFKDKIVPDDLFAIHVRYGGVKGILVPYPDDIFNKICMAEDRRSKPGQYVFAYRPSMLKYKCGPAYVEVHGYARNPTTARLNTAFIVLLLTLGTKIASIECLLKQNVADIEAIGLDRDRAIRFIDATSQASDFGTELLEMLRAGHDLHEPYLRSMLWRYQCMQFNSLRNKLNIIVPKSCYVYGIVDELGILKGNEIYINLPSREGIITGNVLVSRNPSYLPSDMRLLNAVDKFDDMGFHVNCIVFPLGGKTSIPNLMAGGDLDGDKYFVCWDTTIMPPRTQDPDYSVPMPDFKPAPKEKRRPAHLHRALIEMFVRMYTSPLLGRVSNEWQRAVERSPKLANDKYPLELAKIVEVALHLLRGLAATITGVQDMGKTGADFCLLEEHFKRTKRDYGESVNGERPGCLDPLRALVPTSSGYDKPLVYEIDPDLDMRAEYENAWSKHYQEGVKLMAIFNEKLRDAIVQQAAEEKHVRGTKTLSGADKVKLEFKEKYFPPCSDETGEDRTDCFIRASAWYHLGYKRGKVAFAWLGASYLNELKSYRLQCTRLRPMSGKKNKPIDCEGNRDCDQSTRACWTANDRHPRQDKTSTCNDERKEKPESGVDTWPAFDDAATPWNSSTSHEKKTTGIKEGAFDRDPPPHVKPYEVTTRKPSGPWRAPDNREVKPRKKSPDTRRDANARAYEDPTKPQPPWMTVGPKRQERLTRWYDEHSSGQEY